MHTSNVRAVTECKYTVSKKPVTLFISAVTSLNPNQFG